MGEQLKPCPFCGGEARVRSVASFSRIGFNVVCTNCPAASGHDGTSSDEAIAAWNRRSEAAQVRVKLLEWYNDAVGQEIADALGLEAFYIKSPGGSVFVAGKISQLHPDEIEADYDQRIRTALEPDTVTGWQDINTHDGNGKDVLVGWHCEYSGRFIWLKAGLVKGIWYICGSTGAVCHPTHWMPLPPAPEKEK